MTTTVATPTLPPVGIVALAAVAGLQGLLDRFAEGVGAGVDVRYAASSVTEVDRAIRRLQAIKLKLVAAADRAEVSRGSGHSGTGAWLAAQTHSSGSAAAAQVALAAALHGAVPGGAGPSEGLSLTSAALSAGRLSPEHAAVIASTSRQLPASLDVAERLRVEAALVERAQRVDPARLRRTARRALTFAGRADAEVAAHEDAVLRTEESRAFERARLTLHDNLDGTMSGHFTVPTFAGQILRKTIQQLASPRRWRESRPAAARSDDLAIDWAQRYGQAFTELIEHLPTDRLTGKVAATVVVTLDAQRLADLVNSQPQASGVDTGLTLSAGQARRIACNAGLLPAVLGGPSLPLDLGRADRFFTEAQRVALATIYDECAADGCDRPYAWSELHHEDPWHAGGRTDLAKAVPLCGWHHRRIHDPAYRHSVTTAPTGAKSVTFHLRT